MKSKLKKEAENQNYRVSNSSAIDSGKTALQLQDNRPQTIAQRAQADSLSMKSNVLQQKANRTGLPDGLKSGIENLSGHSMDDVKVHYNSAQPAQLNAHAYAQGTQIHLGPGQEKHLAHEAWHVVQQKEGRVQPTTQMKGKVNVNDDKILEKEADIMGAKASQLKGVAQLKGGGSHGKHLHFKVTTVTVHNSATGKTRFVNARHDEDLGVVPSHGAGPAQKTQADADVIAAGAVRLGANESITNVVWNHYTKR